MKIIINGQPASFDCIPRIYPKETDSISLVLTNENNKTIVEPSFSFIVAQKLSISLDSADIVINQKYIIEMRLNNDIIYIGKLMILKEGTDIQNYKNENQSATKTKFR